MELGELEGGKGRCDGDMGGGQKDVIKLASCCCLLLLGSSVSDSMW